MRVTTYAPALLLFVAACGDDGSSHRDDLCKGGASGTSCRWAGTGNQGFNTETPTAHRLASDLYYPSDLTFGPDDRAYIADWNNHRVRRVEQDGALINILGTEYEGDGAPAEEDRLPICNPAGVVGTDVAMNHPTDLKFGPDGLLYVAAWHNNKIRIVDPVTLRTTVLTGNTYGGLGDDNAACAALFNQPKTLVFAPDGTLYTIDQRNVRIRKILNDQVRTVSTIAGHGKLGNLGDGGQALDAEFGFETSATPRPSGGLVLKDNLLYVADSLNHRIRRINLDTGLIDCIAGKSTAGYSGDGGPALNAEFNFPNDLELGPDGRLYVADRYNHVIRAIDLSTNTIETVVGNGTACVGIHGECPDRTESPTEMQLNEPYGLAFDAAGDMYVADTLNSRIVKVLR